MTKSLNQDPSHETKKMAPMIAFNHVSLCFRKHTSLFDLFFRRRNRKLNFWALKDVSFCVYEGDTVGIIGRNGSGKSTLSLVTTRIFPPDGGTVQVNGKVQLLALGVGFQTQLTGRENVYISGSLLGLRTLEIKQRMGEIENFADIGEFMDEPVRTYSSGMKSRLAFAIATAIQPDILILDEVMATGDRAFQDKAIERIKNLHSLTKCAMIISHNPAQLKQLCNKVLWIEKGRLVMDGAPEPILNAYQKFCKNPSQWKVEHPEFFFHENAEIS